MIAAPLPHNEAERLKQLHGLDLLDTPPSPLLDELTELAADICEAPVALISLVDATRQWFKSKCGLGDVTETHRDVSFCAHAILAEDCFVVPDALEDHRFAANPLVTGDPHIRFYAGMPLCTTAGYCIGTLCIIDYSPRILSESQGRALKTLGKTVTALIEDRRIIVGALATARETNTALTKLASTDALTGAMNRRAFSERLEAEHGLVQRQASTTSLLMVDLDHFKSINDVHGHDVGDEALKTFVSVCHSVLRASDVVARWGGEEFMILMPNTVLEEGSVVAERLRLTLAETPIQTGREPIYCTVSGGLGELCESGTIDSRLRSLDAALYDAKRSGRNKIIRVA